MAPSVRLAQMARTAAALVIAGVWRRRDFVEIEKHLRSQERPVQITVTLAVLGFLSACSLVAAQFGIVGMLVFWMAVILLVR